MEADEEAYDGPDAYIEADGHQEIEPPVVQDEATTPHVFIHSNSVQGILRCEESNLRASSYIALMPIVSFV